MTKLLTVFAPLLICLSGCVSNLQKDYVEADSSTYNQVAPAIEKWLTHEPGIVIQPGADAADEKHAWEVKLRSWKFRIEEAKKLIAEQEKND